MSLGGGKGVGVGHQCIPSIRCVRNISEGKQAVLKLTHIDIPISMPSMVTWIV